MTAPPQNLKGIDIQNTSIKLQWDIPRILNEEWAMFVIRIDEVHSPINTELHSVEIPFTEEKPTYIHTVIVF